MLVNFKAFFNYKVNDKIISNLDKKMWNSPLYTLPLNSLQYTDLQSQLRSVNYTVFIRGCNSFEQRSQFCGSNKQKKSNDKVKNKTKSTILSFI